MKFMELHTQLLISEREIKAQVYIAESETVDFLQTNEKVDAFISHVVLESPSPNAAITMAGIKANLFWLHVWGMSRQDIYPRRFR